MKIKIHAREVNVFNLSAGCPNSHRELFRKTLPAASIGERFAKSLTELTTCQKEHPMVRSLFEATAFSFTVNEFTAFEKSHVVEIQADGTCRLWRREENDFDEVCAVPNFGTAKTPAFFYEGGFFVFCEKCQKMVHSDPRVLTYSDECALLVLGDDLLLSYNPQDGFETLGDFAALYQTAKSVLLEVCRKDGMFALYHLSEKRIQKLFDANKVSGDWFDVNNSSGDVAFHDHKEFCKVIGISKMFKMRKDGFYENLF